MNKPYIKRRESIIICAIDILDELGVHGLTSKEIAKRQGITEPAVYKQFAGKKDILLAIIERFSAFDEMIRNTIVEQALGCKEGIVFYARSYGEYYENYPQITTVMFSYDMYRYDPELNNKMMEIYEDRNKFIHDMIRQGQEDGQLSQSLSSSDLADMITGLMISLTFNWKSGGCKFSLKEKILSAVEYMLNN